jgi:hypothetical protein
MEIIHSCIQHKLKAAAMVAWWLLEVHHGCLLFMWPPNFRWRAVLQQVRGQTGFARSEAQVPKRFLRQ